MKSTKKPNPFAKKDDKGGDMKGGKDKKAMPFGKKKMGTKKAGKK